MEDAAPQHDEALDRLLSRAELELLSPDAVQRREIIAHLKLAAASAKAVDAPKHLPLPRTEIDTEAEG